MRVCEDKRQLRAMVAAVNHCPPCEYFDPELTDSSISWTGCECDRSDYAIDCKHRKVCGLRHEWRPKE